MANKQNQNLKALLATYGYSRLKSWAQLLREKTAHKQKYCFLF